MQVKLLLETRRAVWIRQMAEKETREWENNGKNITVKQTRVGSPSKRKESQETT